MQLPLLVGGLWLLVGAVSVSRPTSLYRTFRPQSWEGSTVRQRHRSARRVKRFGYLLAGCGLGALAVQYV